MLKAQLKFNIGLTLIVIPLAWLFSSNICPAHASDEYSPNRGILTYAEDLELTIGKSFILECDEETLRVAVGNPEIADVRVLDRNNVLINAIKPGTTNLIVWYADDTTDTYNITVTWDVGAIEKKLREAVPNADVRVSCLLQNLIAEGEVEDQETMDRIMRILQAYVYRDYIKNLMVLKGAQQVQLEVNIAEVSRSEIKKFGLGWLSNRSASGQQVGLGVFQTGDAYASLATGEEGDVSISDSQISYGMELESPFTNAFQIAVSVLDKDITSIISLLKSHGLARILACPTLVAMSGQEATFLVGGEFPVPMEDDNDGTNINYKSYGVMLEFTPTVIGREKVNLEVKTSVSDIDYSTTVSSGGVTVPGVTTREAGTSLQLKDGQTFAIAGLLKENIDSVVNKVPFLGELPIIGSLFRSKEYLKEETELIIMVTPRLVKAMNREEIPALPGDTEDFNQGDLEFFFLGRLWKENGRDSEKAPQFSGPMGFED